MTNSVPDAKKLARAKPKRVIRIETCAIKCCGTCNFVTSFGCPNVYECTKHGEVVKLLNVCTYWEKEPDSCIYVLKE